MDAFQRVLSELEHRVALAREVFLTEGYLYTESPELAAVYVNSLALDLLFHEPELILVRGDERRTLKRRESESGPGAALRRTKPRCRSPRGPGAPRAVTASGALASLRFGREWYPAALRRLWNALAFGCVRVPPTRADFVLQAQAQATRRALMTERLARVVKGEIEEGLPFDEPRTEEGQQDGQLRPAWRQAYFEGRDRYGFNDDTYPVFDARGRPHVPQVCIDFVTDTLERASGARYRDRGERREFVRGALSFDDFGLDNRRSVESFVSFARTRPDYFDFDQKSPEERVPFRDRHAFFRDIYEHRDEFRPFDIVAVFGLRSDEKLHYHSFFVAERDPLTGMPITVVGNAGRPCFRSWENELQNAPRRAIVAHIRPRLPWLEATLAPAPAGTGDALPPKGSTG